MGKGAARKGIDIAGHSGLINTGSDNVLIDGYPAARKGMALYVRQHSIMEVVSSWEGQHLFL